MTKFKIFILAALLLGSVSAFSQPGTSTFNVTLCNNSVKVAFLTNGACILYRPDGTQMSGTYEYYDGNNNKITMTWSNGVVEEGHLYMSNVSRTSDETIPSRLVINGISFSRRCN